MVKKYSFFTLYQQKLNQSPTTSFFMVLQSLPHLSVTGSLGGFFQNNGPNGPLHRVTPEVSASMAFQDYLIGAVFKQNLHVENHSAMPEVQGHFQNNSLLLTASNKTGVRVVQSVGPKVMLFGDFLAKQAKLEHTTQQILVRREKKSSTLLQPAFECGVKTSISSPLEKLNIDPRFKAHSAIKVYLNKSGCDELGLNIGLQSDIEIKDGNCSSSLNLVLDTILGRFSTDGKKISYILNLNAKSFFGKNFKKKKQVLRLKASRETTAIEGVFEYTRSTSLLQSNSHQKNQPNVSFSSKPLLAHVSSSVENFVTSQENFSSPMIAVSTPMFLPSQPIQASTSSFLGLDPFFTLSFLFLALQPYALKKRSVKKRKVNLPLLVTGLRLSQFYASDCFSIESHMLD